MAEPRPAKKFHENENAPAGRSNARCALKCVSPAKMIHPMVSITPVQRTLVSRAIAVMRRYRRNAVNAQTPIARNVAGIETQVSCRVPTRGRCSAQVRVDQTSSRRGQKKAAYCESPIAPDAIESGALKESCQINRNDTSRPSFCGP